MADRLREAIEQATQNAKDVRTQCGRQLRAKDFHGAVVLWSSPDERPSEEQWSEHDGVFVVPGPVLEDWLDSVVRPGPVSVDVRQVWAAVEAHAAVRDARDAIRGMSFQPTLQQLFWQRAVVPVVAALAAAYAFFATSRFHRWPLLLGEAAGALVIGGVANREKRLRWAALGWLVGVLAGLLVLFVVVIA